jgi:hypothetical protein
LCYVCAAVTILSYLFEIGAFQHLLRIFDQPENQPAAANANNMNANPPPQANAPAADAPANDAPANAEAANHQTPSQPVAPSVQRPQMSWSRYIARRLRAGVGLPTQDGIFFDLCAFIIGFVGSLVPEWNPYGHMHV